MPIAGLILAAGGSTRMKTTKQLLKWGDASLLQHVIQTVKQSKLDPIYLVLGAESDAIKQQVDLEGLTIIENIEWEKGLGTSIAIGMDVLIGKPGIAACLIVLADQPFITEAYLNTMVAASDANTIIASNYNGKAGVPCIFPRRFFPDLLQLQEDRGASRLLNTLSTHVQILEATADLRDIDTPEAYRKYLPE